MLNIYNIEDRFADSLKLANYFIGGTLSLDNNLFEGSLDNQRFGFFLFFVALGVGLGVGMDFHATTLLKLWDDIILLI